MSTHTPGPWRECGRKNDVAGCVCRMVWSTTADQNVATGMREGRAISCVHGEWGDGPGMVYGEIPAAEAAANARLIAAAPELLAVVKTLAEAHTTDSDHCALCGADASADMHASGCLVMSARTAIAKAEGR